MFSEIGVVFFLILLLFCCKQSVPDVPLDSPLSSFSSVLLIFKEIIAALFTVTAQTSIETSPCARQAERSPREKGVYQFGHKRREVLRYPSNRPLSALLHFGECRFTLLAVNNRARTVIAFVKARHHRDRDSFHCIAPAQYSSSILYMVISKNLWVYVECTPSWKNTKTPVPSDRTPLKKALIQAESPTEQPAESLASPCERT